MLGRGHAGDGLESFWYRLPGRVGVGGRCGGCSFGGEDGLSVILLLER